MGLEHPAYKGDAEEGPFIHFFVGNWSQSGGGQVVGAKIEYDQWIHVCGVYNGIVTVAGSEHSCRAERGVHPAAPRSRRLPARALRRRGGALRRVAA